MTKNINIPQDMIETLKLYVENKIPPGSFTLSVLQGNLFNALGLADEYWKYHLYDLASYIVSKLPYNCYGSELQVLTWLKRK